MIRVKSILSTLIMSVLFFNHCSFSSVIYLQAGAFKSLDNAKKSQKKVKQHTSRIVDIVSHASPLDSFYYVVVTDFNDLGQAKKLQLKLSKGGIKSWIKVQDNLDKKIYDFTIHPVHEAVVVEEAYDRLEAAIENPEYMIDHWVNLPIAPNVKTKKIFKLTINEAILLSLRYNPNLQGQELARITQRYSLYQAQNEFELQYALSGTADFEKSTSDGISSPGTQSYLLTPELTLKTIWGTEYSLSMQNNYANTTTYNPVLDFNIIQPLLRNAGPTVNTENLFNAINSEINSKLLLRQTIIEQVTSVITLFRAVIQQEQQLQSTKVQLKDAIKTFNGNKLRIKAGQMERTGNIQQSYQVESLRLSVVQGENELISAYLALTQEIGLDPEMKLGIINDKKKLDNVTVPDMQESIDYALAHNIDYITQQITLKNTERAYRVALNQQLWQLDLTADVTTGSAGDIKPRNTHLSSLFNGNNVNSSVNLQLSIPINDVDLKGQLISAKVELEAARINIISVKRNLITTIKGLIYEIQTSAISYRLAIKQERLAEQSYELEKRKQDAGISSALDVSNTQNQLLDAQINLIDAQISYLNSTASLDQSLGRTLEKWKIKLRYGS